MLIKVLGSKVNANGAGNASTVGNATTVRMGGEKVKIKQKIDKDMWEKGCIP